MSFFTQEQNNYITNNNLNNTKLNACAGSGKTRCIIFRINHLIKNKKIKQNEVLMLTFSRFTRDDFLNKIKKYKVTTILEQQVKTIDSFAKNIIDVNNEIDVSLLSYRFLKYLEDTESDVIKKNKKLANIKIIFVDEAQDLNETQYKILMLLHKKNNTIINLIGDPNQNIYQFRNSNDKYLNEFDGEPFNLTKNFRSHDHIINFSKYLRPNPNLDIVGTLGKSKTNCKPTIIFHEHDNELEVHIINILNSAIQSGIEFHDIAIMAPTRGRMKSYGKSHGLCFVSNLLYKNNIKFKQFYEETTDDFTGGIKYKPEKNHINLLTYMGSKGLEWKFVILIDADICLINKRHFTNEKHNHDQYLLYVACSRAIDNVIIFAKYKSQDGTLSFQLNPWFSKIPKIHYTLDTRFEKYFNFPQIKPHEIKEKEKKIIKIIDKLDEKTLDELSQMCKFGHGSNPINKIIKRIYPTDYSEQIDSNIFLGKFIENLFFIYYREHKGFPKKKYIDIENIINSTHIITNVPIKVSEWFYLNRNQLSWENFDRDKQVLDKVIVDTVESKFSRSRKLEEHTIVNDSYFKSFILSMSDKIKKNYEIYNKTQNKKKLRQCLFNILIVNYSLETQHYFHALSNGKKFLKILSYKSFFNDIENFAVNTKMVFIDNNIVISRWGLVGEIDLIEKKKNENIIWEIKCVSDITLKHILQIMMYNIMYNNYENECTININIINFLKGETFTVNILLLQDNINRIKEIFTQY